MNERRDLLNIYLEQKKLNTNSLSEENFVKIQNETYQWQKFFRKYPIPEEIKIKSSVSDLYRNGLYWQGIGVRMQEIEGELVQETIPNNKFIEQMYEKITKPRNYIETIKTILATLVFNALAMYLIWLSYILIFPVVWHKTPLIYIFFSIIFGFFYTLLKFIFIQGDLDKSNVIETDLNEITQNTKLIIPSEYIEEIAEIRLNDRLNWYYENDDQSNYYHSVNPTYTKRKARPCIENNYCYKNELNNPVINDYIFGFDRDITYFFIYRKAYIYYTQILLKKELIFFLHNCLFSDITELGDIQLYKIHLKMIKKITEETIIHVTKTFLERFGKSEEEIKLTKLNKISNEIQVRESIHKLIKDKIEKLEKHTLLYYNETLETVYKLLGNEVYKILEKKLINEKIIVTIIKDIINQTIDDLTEIYKSFNLKMANMKARSFIDESDYTNPNTHPHKSFFTDYEYDPIYGLNKETFKTVQEQYKKFEIFDFQQNFHLQIELLNITDELGNQIENYKRKLSFTWTKTDYSGSFIFENKLRSMLHSSRLKLRKI